MDSTVTVTLPHWLVETAKYGAGAILGVIFWTAWESFRKSTFGG